MNIINKLKISLITSAAVLFALSINISKAAELNLPGFSGTMNTTITSGFSLRASELDCMMMDGYNRTFSASGANLNSHTPQALLGGYTAAQVWGGKDAAFKASAGTIKSKNSAGCAQVQKDGYGNVSKDPLPWGDINSDDGRLNFRQGSVIDATQTLYSEVKGTTDSGMGVNFSYVATYNPALDISAPDFKDLTEKAKNQFESDVQVLDAYITNSFVVGDSYVDVTAGRFATSWGEATFIPIGMNGLVTNALDLTKLRGPGASIRNALVPTEQISLNFNVGDVGIEIYGQFQESHITLDPKGSFFGNDVAGVGGTSILASGSYGDEYVGTEQFCTYSHSILMGGACNAQSKLLHTQTSTRDAHSISALSQYATNNASSSEWTEWLTNGRTFDFGNAAGSAVISNGMETFTHADGDSAWLAEHVYNDTKNPLFAYDSKGTVTIEAANDKNVYARDDGQFGIKANAYLDNIGEGIDLSFYYSNYHSKIPYTQIIGAGGVWAGDHVGMYAKQFRDYTGSALDDGATGHSVVTDAAGNLKDGFDLYSTTDVNAKAFLAMMNGAMSSGVCGGFTALSAVKNTFQFDSPVYGQNYNQANKEFTRNLLFGTVIEDSMEFNPALCMAGGRFHTGSTLAYMQYGTSLLPAITPLNRAKFQFVYPEDNQIFGVSFNTNVSGTTVQGELNIRPDFPLATGVGDQINQIGDAAGVSAALTMFAVDSFQTSAASVGAISYFKALVDAYSPTGTSWTSQLIDIERSSLINLKKSGVNLNQDYRSTAWHNMDTWSADIGTTTAFNASHPVTRALGADSVILLTELGAVYIADLDDQGRGFVARSGFNEGGGEHLCLGAFQNMSTAARDAVAAAAASASYAPAFNAWKAGSSSSISIDHILGFDTAGLTNMGSSITDAVFGNGNYCESQMGADELAMTYRLVTSVRYNNVNNSAWSINPTVSWAHDFKGYGPASLGGFVPGKMALSLGLNATKGDGVSLSLSYVNQIGADNINQRNDMDTLSASVSYAF